MFLTVSDSTKKTIPIFTCVCVVTSSLTSTLVQLQPNPLPSLSLSLSKKPWLCATVTNPHYSSLLSHSSFLILLQLKSHNHIILFHSFGHFLQNSHTAMNLFPLIHHFPSPVMVLLHQLFELVLIDIKG